MKDFMTAPQRSILNIKEKASFLEEQRLKAYSARLQELVTETAAGNLPPEQYPMKLAARAFRLGVECGSNKMYEYL